MKYPDTIDNLKFYKGNFKDFGINNSDNIPGKKPKGLEDLIPDNSVPEYPGYCPSNFGWRNTQTSFHEAGDYGQFLVKETRITDYYSLLDLNKAFRGKTRFALERMFKDGMNQYGSEEKLESLDESLFYSPFRPDNYVQRVKSAQKGKIVFNREYLEDSLTMRINSNISLNVSSGRDGGACIRITNSYFCSELVFSVGQNGEVDVLNNADIGTRNALKVLEAYKPFLLEEVYGLKLQKEREVVAEKLLLHPTICPAKDREEYTQALGLHLVRPPRRRNPMSPRPGRPDPRFPDHDIPEKFPPRPGRFPGPDIPERFPPRRPMPNRPVPPKRPELPPEIITRGRLGW